MARAHLAAKTPPASQGEGEKGTHCSASRSRPGCLGGQSLQEQGGPPLYPLPLGCWGPPPTTLPLEGFHLTDGDSEARERGPRACPRQAGPGAQSVGRRPPPSLLLGGRLCRLPGSLPAPHASWGEGRSRRDPISASLPPAASQALCSGTAPSRAGLSPSRHTLWPALCPWSC